MQDIVSTTITDATADEKKATVLVGLDLSAAFDTINHDVLISRLESQFGVDGGASSWLRSYLTDRQQFVKLGDHSYMTKQCASGVPQRSVLGPLLFTAYVSPVRELIESHGVSYHQFADDTTRSCSSPRTSLMLDRLSKGSLTAQLLFAVASPGFVVRRGKAVSLVMGTHGELQGRKQQLFDD